jgi:hypothetical protein
VLRNSRLTIFEVPHPRAIVTGPAPAQVTGLSQSRVMLSLAASGRYRVAVRYSPYWETSAGCLTRGEDGMLRLTVSKAGRVALAFDVDAGPALRAVAGRAPAICAGA